MKKTAVFIFILALLFFSQKNTLPETRQVSLTPLKTENTAYLLPLDSRPVCSDHPRKLARLAGTTLILPPNQLLDNYRQPADTEKLLVWLKAASSTPSKKLYLSTDMLLSGGLIASRQSNVSATVQQQLLSELKQLCKKHENTSIFTIIPRLLISDELLPDRWYKYKLLRYSQLYHQALVTGDYAAALQGQEYAEAIPEAVLAKYIGLFNNSYAFNRELLVSCSSSSEIIIGQDDGHLWGLSSLTAEKLAFHLSRKPQAKAHLTYGADEIASTLIARTYLKAHKLEPKVYIQYADKSIPNLHMPYMAASVETVLQEKLNLLGASLAPNKQSADFILFVNCGHDGYLPAKTQAIALKELLHEATPVALIDLTANFELQELLMPKLLAEKVPLNKLIAYGGWNTFSNSAGTSLAQASIFLGRLQELEGQEQQLALRTANLQLLTEQLLDNYYYQKEYHWPLKKELQWRCVEPTDLTPKDKAVAEAFIQTFMTRKASELLNTNLGKTPFYSVGNQHYYLKAFHVKTKLPWNRIFEIDLQTTDFILGLQEK